MATTQTSQRKKEREGGGASRVLANNSSCPAAVFYRVFGVVFGFMLFNSMGINTSIFHYCNSVSIDICRGILRSLQKFGS